MIVAAGRAGTKRKTNKVRITHFMLSQRASAEGKIVETPDQLFECVARD